MSQASFDREQLLQLPKEQLVDILLQLQQHNQQLQEQVQHLGARIADLEARLGTNSSNSSKPPSSEVLIKPETPKSQGNTQTDQQKRKPGGQKGHTGSTRKGFGKPHRCEALSLETCPKCGSRRMQTLTLQTRQVACLAERPIEIVEFSCPVCLCTSCQTTSTPPWPSRLVGNSDLDSHLMAMLVWLGHYGHFSYDKQAQWSDPLQKSEKTVSR